MCHVYTLYTPVHFFIFVLYMALQNLLELERVIPVINSYFEQVSDATGKSLGHFPQNRASPLAEIFTLNKITVEQVH